MHMNYAKVIGWACFVTLLAACGTIDRRFPLREPMWHDNDLRSVSLRCHPDPNRKDPHHQSCAPKSRYNPLIWDGADNLFFRPLSETFGIVTSGESIDVNSMDEVPDSSWFSNRIGLRPISMEDFELGACTPDQLLDGKSAGDGAWIVDHGKTGGATDGFRVTVPGKGRYLFKADDEDEPEKPSAAQTIGAHVYHAVGYYTTCEQVVYFRPATLKLMPGLRWKHNFGGESEFGQKELEGVLAHCPQDGVYIRMQASAWLPGYPLGGFQYQGTRSDDPNDVIPHEDRRELRGKRLVNAWLDRFDDRRGNTLDMWIADRPGPPDSSPGHVLHNSLDTSEAFGSEWAWVDVSKRLGYAYVFDWGDVGADLFLLGGRTNTWDVVQKKPGKEFFDYFNVEDFTPDQWKDEYPISAFSRMTERDGAWMARILARFTPEMVRSLGRMAQFTAPENTKYLTDVLSGRLEKILERYLTRLSPLADVHVEGTDNLCAKDLAEWRGLRPTSAFRYRANSIGADRRWRQESVIRRANAEVCVAPGHIAPDGGLPETARERYLRIRIEDGVAKGPLVAHLYDLGPHRGLQLVGLERPEE
jgi:hypothetical protein